MKQKKQPLAGSRRRVTDEQVRALQTWVPFARMARDFGISLNYARKIRKGTVIHKNPSP